MHMMFSDSSGSKEPACNAGDSGSIPGLGRSPGEGIGSPLQYSCLENPHGQTSLAGYIVHGVEELDTTERFSLYGPATGQLDLINSLYKFLFVMLLSAYQ